MAGRNCLRLVPSVSRGRAHRINFFSVDVIFLVSLPLFFFLNKNTGARLTRGPQELSIRAMKYSESLIFLGDL